MVTVTDLYAADPGTHPFAHLSRIGNCALKTSPVFKLGRIMPRPGVGLVTFSVQDSSVEVAASPYGRRCAFVAMPSERLQSPCSLVVLLTIACSPPFPSSMFDLRPGSARPMVWRRSCVLTLSYLDVGLLVFARIDVKDVRYVIVSSFSHLCWHIPC